MMKSSGRTKFLLIDAVGALVVSLSTAGGFWLLFVQTNDVAFRLNKLRAEMGNAQADLRMAEAARQRQQTVLTGLKSSLAQVGNLPDETATNDYFQELSREASRHGVRVIRQQPLSPRKYPGLLEERFQYDVTGETANLISFLSAVENTPYWADIGYLVVRGAGTLGDERSAPVGSLTFSVFSARAEQSPMSEEPS